MSKAESIAKIAAENDLSQVKAKAIYEGIFADIGAELKKEGRVSISGFGTLNVTKRAARTGRNPSTGESIKIKAVNVVKFKAAPTLKELAQKVKIAAKK